MTHGKSSDIAMWYFTTTANRDYDPTIVGTAFLPQPIRSVVDHDDEWKVVGYRNMIIFLLPQLKTVVGNYRKCLANLFIIFNVIDFTKVCGVRMRRL